MTAESQAVTTPSEQLLSAESFDQAIQIAGGAVVHGGDLVGDGFSLLKDKNTLTGTRILVLDWAWRTDEDTKREYVSVRVFTEHNQKLIVNDGGTGIPNQILEMEAKGVVSGPVYFRGLRSSTYDPKNPDGSLRTDDKGKPLGKATTWYFDTTKDA